MNPIKKKGFSSLLNLLLFLSSFTLSLFFCEIFVRKFKPQPVGGNFRTFSKNKDYFINIPNKKTFSRIEKYKTFKIVSNKEHLLDTYKDLENKTIMAILNKQEIILSVNLESTSYFQS